MTRLIFSILVLVFFAGSFVHPQTKSKQATIPDVYELTGGSLKITYLTTSKGGQPEFTYQDGSQTQSFKGKEIRETKSEIGTLVTVTTRMTVDSGSTTFTLLLPAVRLDGFTPGQIQTIGITTVHKFSVIPARKLGQTELYTTMELSGTAKFVVF